MPNNNEGNPAPESLEAKAIAELEKEGFVVGEHQPVPDEGELKETPAPSKKEEPAKEPEKPAEEPKTPPKDQEQSRTPSMVEAWKLKVAEDQKETALSQVKELQTKLDDLSKQKAPVTQTQKDEVADDIAAIAEEAGVDPGFLTKFANTILNKAKPSSDLEKTVGQLAKEKQLEKELNVFSDQFEKEIAPIVQEKYQLSGTALTEFKSKLKDLAFSEMYAKVPLAKIFKAEEEAFALKAPKKSSEGGSMKVRQNNVVDLDNLDEESFKNLPPDKVEQLIASKSSGGWVKPGSAK